MKTVTFSEAANRSFRKLPTTVQAQVRAKLARYGETGAGDVTRMVGDDGARLRIGDYRAIFTETETTIDVVAVGHRRDIYR